MTIFLCPHTALKSNPAQRCSSFKALNVMCGEGRCVHCNLALSKRSVCERPVSPCLSFFFFPFHLFLPYTSLISFSPSRLHSSLPVPVSSHVSFASHFLCLTFSLSCFTPSLPHVHTHTHTQNQASESHLICSPLRLSDTQHPERS